MNSLLVVEKRHLYFEFWPKIGEKMGHSDWWARESCEGAAGGAGDIRQADGMKVGKAFGAFPFFDICGKIDLYIGELNFFTCIIYGMN